MRASIRTIILTAIAAVSLLATAVVYAAPVVKISFPAEGMTVSSAKLIVKGNVSDASGVTDLIVNGRGFELKQAKNLDFEKTVELGPGENIILVTALSASGDVTEKQVNVFYVPGAAVSPVSAAPVKKYPAYNPADVEYGDVPEKKATGGAVEPRQASSELVAAMPDTVQSASPAALKEPSPNLVVNPEEKKKTSPAVAPKNSDIKEKPVKPETAKKPVVASSAAPEVKKASKPVAIEKKVEKPATVVKKETEKPAVKDTAKPAAPAKKIEKAAEFAAIEPPEITAIGSASAVEKIRPRTPALYNGDCFIVVAKSFLFEENAEKTAKSIASKGIEASVLKETIGKSDIYHITLGYYLSRGDAEYSLNGITLPGYKPEVKMTTCHNVAVPNYAAVNSEPVLRPAPRGDEIDLRNNIKPAYMQFDKP